MQVTFVIMKVIEERASVIDKNNDSNGKNGHLSKTVTNIDIETATPITQQSDGDKSSSSGKGILFNLLSFDGLFHLFFYGIIISIRNNLC